MNEYRELEIYIGPFAEWEGKKLDKNSAIKLVSNGNIDTLKISVSISKSVSWVEDSCQITIYNLKQETRRAFKRGMSVNVFAGYEGKEKELVFKGGLGFVDTERQGPDIVTTLNCATALGGRILSNTSKTYTNGVPVSEAVKELAETIPGVTVDPKNIKIKGTVGYSGFSFMGSTTDALNKLANQFGFSWSITDGIFTAVKDGSYLSDGAILSSNGLRKVSPRIEGPWMFQEGVDIWAQYQPNVGPWKRIQVKSELNPYLSKNFTCWQISYTLSPKESAWDMHIVDMLAFSTSF